MWTHPALCAGCTTIIAYYLTVHKQENQRISGNRAVASLGKQGNETRTTRVVPLIHEGRTCHANEADLVQDSDANWACARPACLWQFALQAGPVKHQDSNAHRGRMPNVCCSCGLCPVNQDCQNSLRPDLPILSLP